jgi:hypothetical protein
MATRSPKTPDTSAPIASPPVTFDAAVVNQMIAEAVAVALKAQAAELAAKPAGKSDQSSKNEIAAMKAFKKRGFGIIKPHIDTKTFNLWVKEGLRPKEGEKSVPVANLRLFHRSQCRELTKEEKAELAAKANERVVANKQMIDAAAKKVVPINQLSA